MTFAKRLIRFRVVQNTTRRSVSTQIPKDEQKIIRRVFFQTSDDDPFISRKRILIHISYGLEYVYFFLFLEHIYCPHFVSFIRMSGEYLLRYGQGSVIKDPLYSL